MPLSPAQKSIALLIAGGRARKQISGELRISPQTVKDYVRIIYSKLGVHDRHHLMAKVLDASTAQH